MNDPLSPRILTASYSIPRFARDCLAHFVRSASFIEPFWQGRVDLAVGRSRRKTNKKKLPRGDKIPRTTTMDGTLDGHTLI
jgi:hypothetical protein